MSLECNRNEVLAIARAFMNSRILLSAVELDLFTKMKDGPRFSDELAEAEGWDSRGLRILMDALVAMDLLAKLPDGAYLCRRSTLKLLTHGYKESVLPLVGHRANMWKSWSNITDIIRTGSNPNAMHKTKRGPLDIEHFIGAMHVIGKEMADSVAASLDLTGYTKLLDVAGGSGVYAMAFLERAPHMKAIVFDLPDVIEIARKKITEEGYIDRIELIAGDFHADEMPGGCDLALLSAIIHMNSREANRDLYAKIVRALEPGGALLIRDHVMDPTRTSPTAGAIFAVNMLAATRTGDTYTFDEIREDMESAGFTDIELIKDGLDMDQVVIGKKTTGLS